MGGAQSQEEEPTPSEAGGDTPGIYEIAELEPRQWPIVYSSQYNIGFMGLQRLHPFDSAKWGKIFDHLQEAGMIKGKEDILEPREITKRELQMVHTEEYLESLTVIYPQHDPKDHFTTGSLPIIVQYECGNGSRGP
ncbi:Histone deacetylase 11, partial [Geodia barretti]